MTSLAMLPPHGSSPTDELDLTHLPPLPDITSGELKILVFTHKSSKAGQAGDIAQSYEKLAHIGDSIAGGWRITRFLILVADVDPV